MGLNRNLGNIPEVIKESGGKIGIGSSNPNTLLEVASTTSNAARIRVNNTSTTVGQYRGYEFASGTTFKGGFLQDQNTDLISIFTPIGGQSVNVNSIGNVGIGTVNPDRKLTVNSDLPIRLEANSNSSGYYTLLGTNYDYDKSFLINNKGDEIFTYSQQETLGLSLSNPRAGNIRFSTNGAERMRIFSGGNVFIGSSPSDSGYKLDVNGLVRMQSGLTLSNYDGLSLKLKAATSTGSTYLRFFNSGDTARGYLGLFWNGTSDYMVCDAGPLEMNFASSNKFTFNGSNVGINESNPISKLHVTGTMRTALVSGSGGDTLISAIIGVSNGYLINVDTGNNITHTWHTGTNNPSMRITSGGNVLIGTTTDSGDKLNVNGSIKATAFNMAGNHNASISTNSGWSAFQTLIPTGTLLGFSTYLISVWWTHNGSGQPYEVACSFMHSPVGTNGTGVDTEFTPMMSTHTGGTGAIMTFRSRAGNGSTSGIEVKFVNFSSVTGTIFVRATKMQGF